MKDGHLTVERLCAKYGFPVKRLRFYAEADETVFASVQRGIVFVMAFWSGPSHTFLKYIIELLKRLDPEGKLELVVLDTDGIPRLYEFPPFGGKLGGYGEAAWIRNGKIEAVLTAGSCQQPLKGYEEFTRNLLTD